MGKRDVRWILDAACRDRSLDELPPLAEALRPIRRPDAETIERAHRQRKRSETDSDAALDPHPRPARLLDGEGEDGPAEGQNVSLVRPYGIAGGDAAQPRYALPLSTIVRTTANDSQLRKLLPEQQRICYLCREPHDINQVAERLSHPIGVARMLVADLVEDGFLAVQPNGASARLSRGDSIALPAKVSEGTLVIGLGWEAPGGNGLGFDLDASAIGAKNGKVYSDLHFVFFNNLRTPEGSISHTGEDAGVEGDQETILVHFAEMPADIDKIVFALSIYEGKGRNQNIGQVRNAYIRIASYGWEIARYEFSEETATETAMVFGELYRYQGEWKFRAVGQGYASGLPGIAIDFGVNV
ncbi:TerD family protein [Streptomyces sp. NBC_01334]|uniref:TerD family protein n=1 Tax=Streptomyces sp. NBC_01334 TaxID=2903827 RepID=UPI002E100D46|nr:TerD family protein [Streptomyces sp. NBC_01334]